MKWFDNTQNHLRAEGQELFHLSLPSAPSRWGHGYSKDRSIPWRQGREPTNKCIQTSYLQQHNIYSPVHLGNVAQAVSPLVAFVHFVQKAGSGGAEPTMNPGLTTAPDLSHPCSEESPCLSTPACPSFLTGKQKSQRCARLIKSSRNRFAYTGNAGTYSTQKIFEDSFIHIGLFFFATAKNGISLPVIVIVIKKCFPDNFDIQKAPE